jgi:hypothetical protein
MIPPRAYERSGHSLASGQPIAGWYLTRTGRDDVTEPTPPPADETHLLDHQPSAPWDYKQWSAYTLGLTAVLLMGLFPPFAEERWERPPFGMFSPGPGAKKLDSRFVGYGYLFAECYDRTVSEGPSAMVEYHIVWPVLLGQWLVVAVATLLTVQRLGRRASPGPRPATPGMRFGVIGPTLLGVGLLMIFAGCGSFLSTPLFGGAERAGMPRSVCCGVLGIPIALVGMGICIGRMSGPD